MSTVLRNLSRYGCRKPHVVYHDMSLLIIKWLHPIQRGNIGAMEYPFPHIWRWQNMPLMCGNAIFNWIVTLIKDTLDLRTCYQRLLSGAGSWLRFPSGQTRTYWLYHCICMFYMCRPLHHPLWYIHCIVGTSSVCICLKCQVVIHLRPWVISLTLPIGHGVDLCNSEC